MVTALAAPVLTRLYAPHDFGIYAIALAVFNLIAAVVCLRYEMAIVLPRTNRSAVNVVALCVIVTVFMAFTATLICLVSWMVLFLGRGPGLEWWAALLIPFGVLFQGGQQILRFWCVRTRQFSTITRMVLTQTLVTLGIQVAAGFFWGSDAGYLMLGTVVGLFCMVCVAWPGIRMSLPVSLLSAVRRSRVLAVAKRHRRFPVFSSPYNFVAQAAGRILLLILAVFVPTATIGEFALAQRVVYLPVSVLTSSMSQVFYSRAVQHLGDLKLQQFVVRIMVAGVLIFAPLVAINFIFSQQLFQFAFGVRWAEAGQFAAYLGIASAVISLTAWLDRVYDIHGRQLLALLLEAGNDVFSLGALALVMYVTRNAVSGIVGYSLATVAFYMLWTYVTFRIAKFPAKFFGTFLVAIAASATFVALSGVIVVALTPNRFLQGMLFVALNVPVLVAGIRIGRNGLSQRETAFASIHI